MDKEYFFANREKGIKQSIIDALCDYSFAVGETSKDGIHTTICVSDVGCGDGINFYPVTTLSTSIDLATGKKHLLVNGVRDGESFSVSELYEMFRSLSRT